MELKNTMIGFAVVLLFGSGVYFYKNYINPAKIQIEEPNNPILLNQEKQSVAFLVVHIEGAVRRPGVYRLKHGDRVIDAVKIAGGSKANANLSVLNLAEKVKDGQKITVPEKIRLQKKRTANSGISINSGSATAGLISINCAAQKELEKLPGIGPATAKRIIQYRSENGGFSCLEDIMKVKRIGKKSFEKIKSRITL